MAKVKTLVAAVGKITGTPFHAAAAEYERRLKDVQVTEIDIRKKMLAPDMQKEESEALLAATKGFYRIALDPGGKTYSSEKFAEILQSWRDLHGPLGFMIGGADGHPKGLLALAEQKISFGPMILPHLLARVVLLEQLYRAETILKKHPYHRG